MNNDDQYDEHVMTGIEFDQIEHLEAPEVGDTISRLASLHAEERVRERAQALELIRQEPPLRYRDAPCRRAERAGLAVVGGYLLGGLAAVLGALWIAGFSVDVALKLAGVR